MNLLKNIPAAVFLLLSVQFYGKTSETGRHCGAAGPEDIIPAPASYEIHDGTFSPGHELKLFVETAGKPSSDAVRNLRQEMISSFREGFRTLPYVISETSGKSDADITVLSGTGGPDSESYLLSVTEDGISIEAPDAAGAFYAMQSIVMMMGMSETGDLRCCTVRDNPRFAYRGLHFDVSRHFRSKEFLMKQMDAMALLKLNRMHLHLTDGAGWRLEIGACPRLTEFAAWRPYRKWSDWWASERHYCEAGTAGAYGGFYTKDDIREILEYAAERHIEVIPEIEMPGHSDEVIAAYPELSCNGRQYGNCDLCPGKEETYVFLETVLEEVMALFPSEYVHIGGDEASKEAWKTCPDCRKRMQEEGLENVDELQSYFIRRMEKFVNAHGKRIIGWDEIMQGGLAPDATVMSWRGSEGGVAAASSGHDVIMTPNGYCYLNYTQDAPFREPVGMGGYLTLEKAYSYEPEEPGMTPEARSRILGIQGNLWAEYLPEDSLAEYMYYPRAFAIAETGWSPAGKKDFRNFRKRAAALLGILQARGYRTFDLENEYGERKESLHPVSHLGRGCVVSYASPYDGKYPASGPGALTDGLLGGWSYGDGRWQGFLTDMDITVDLGETKPVRYIGATFMQIISAWVYLPEKVEISVSDDGKDGTFRTVGTVSRDLSDTLDGLYFKTYGTVCDETCRYIRIRAEKPGRDGAWLFTDEITVN